MVVMMNTHRFIKLLLLLTRPLTGAACACQAEAASAAIDALCGDPDAAQEVPARTLAKQLRKAPRNSGPGPSGSRFTHWQACQHSPGAMSALGKVVDRIAAGQVPPWAAAGLALTTLTPLRKKNGRLRPVAAGEVLRLLVGEPRLARTSWAHQGH